MTVAPLAFEESLHDQEVHLARLESLEAGSVPSAELRRLRRSFVSDLRAKYCDLTPWDTVLVSRHPARPQTADYIDLVFEEFTELHGDRAFGDDRAIRTGFARVGDFKCMLVGHHKGRTYAERQQCFYGCAHPEGYRKALAKMHLAAKFRLPVVCLIDTPGAYPGVGAEERGQSQLIATSILEMTRLPTPVVSVVIGEGGSGGALGIGIGDRVSMMQHAYYSVISPEGCAGILWKHATDQTKPKAATSLKLVATDLLSAGVIDEIVPEPVGGAHRSPRDASAALKSHLIRALKELTPKPTSTLLDDRYSKLRRIGVYL